MSLSLVFLILSQFCLNFDFPKPDPQKDNFSIELKKLITELKTFNSLEICLTIEAGVFGLIKLFFKDPLNKQLDRSTKNVLENCIIYNLKIRDTIRDIYESNLKKTKKTEDFKKFKNNAKLFLKFMQGQTPIDEFYFILLNVLIGIVAFKIFYVLFKKLNKSK